MEKVMVVLETFRKTNISQAGYDVKLSCKLQSERYSCPICQRLMRNPVQTARGEVACSYCYENAKIDRRCPLDGEFVEPNELFFDKAKAREIRSLQCSCKYQENGCTWNGTVDRAEEHMETCDFIPQKCYLCGVEIRPSEQMQHLEVCEKWSVEKGCLYAGCTYKAEDVDDLNNHMTRNAVTHNMLHFSAVANIQTYWKLQVEELRKSTEERETKMERDMEQLKEQLSKLMKYASDMENNYDSKTKMLEEKINQLEKAKPSTDEPNIKVMSDSIHALEKNIAEFDLRQQLFENTSHDGKLIWKITDVSRRMQQAKTGSVTALHSAPIFTSKYGYKFCGRLYLFGDGIGRGSHASLFFVLLKSEYDDLLEWPFTKQVHFRLINQEDPSKDITESFIPDGNSSSFTKPTKQMNIAAGCPRFVKQELLNNGFIKDDALYIEVFVSS